jgi:chitin disaccharide deacetylase
LKSLIVTADDVGLHRGMTEGAVRGHREGVVTACSIVANGRAFDDAVARLRDVPALEAGVHLTLVEEKSLTGIRFPRRWTTFLVSRPRVKAIEAEMRAQVEKVLGSGLRVTHLNSHQHLHMLPGLFQIVLRLADEYGIGYVRTVDDRGGRAGLARRAAVGVLSALGRRARRRTRTATSDRTIGVAEAGHLHEISSLLDHVEGVTELVTHPGNGVDEYSHWNYDWENETRALTDPGVRDEIANRGIRLIAPSAIGRRVS